MTRFGTRGLKVLQMGNHAEIVNTPLEPMGEFQPTDLRRAQVEHNRSMSLLGFQESTSARTALVTIFKPGNAGRVE